MSGHTKGPWRVYPPGSNFQKGKLFVRADEALIATVSGDVRFAEQQANARLMAEAPALLALARRIAEHFENTDAPLGRSAALLIATIEDAPRSAK